MPTRVKHSGFITLKQTKTKSSFNTKQRSNKRSNTHNILVPKSNADITKKCALKPPNAVIDRICHDTTLGDEQWIIGYMDRFDGMQERDFDEFNFKDITSDNFLPVHRIYYFKCNGTVVWDRKNRIDDVFASTGGKKIVDVLFEQAQQQAQAEDEE